MESEIKRLAILGSTGSIGRQTLDVVRALPGHFRVLALAAGQKTALLDEQINEFKPDYYYTSAEYQSSEAAYRPKLKECRYMSLEDMACHPEADIVVIATSGTSGLKATLAAVCAGKKVALANKESLVAAGEIIVAEIRKSKGMILPVDSEHSAIWQCLRGEMQPARRIILTASGGPFRGYSKEQMEGITVSQALEHPSWQMGKKVTIDSATLMNKGLEIIEAHWLFDMPVDDIQVLVHPGSIIHSMVEFIDGSVKAQMGFPDMRLPIQYALTFPDRVANAELPCLDWDNLTGLSFEPPDTENFPCLRLAVEAAKGDGTLPAVLCAADEAAVDLFLSERIGFTDIARLVEKTLEEHHKIDRPDLDEIVTAGKWAKDRVRSLAGGDN